jgi:putative flippase GtrA
MTLAYLVLYAALREAMGAQAANAVSWVVTAVGDTAANRRLTFRVYGRAGAFRAQAEGLLVFGLGLAITSGALLTLDTVVTEPARALELGVLAVANLVAGLLRFVLLRWWVFAPGR